MPGDIRRVWISKAGGGERGLGIPNVIDRVVQEAVRQVLEPVYEPTFHASSHGFRPRFSAAAMSPRQIGSLRRCRPAQSPSFRSGWWSAKQRLPPLRLVELPGQRSQDLGH